MRERRFAGRPVETGSNMMDVDSAHTHAFPTASEFVTWLAQYHAVESHLWLKLHKRSSGIRSVTWPEAVVEALAWGWIDGIRKTNDESSWFQRFTPRKARSVWSIKNRTNAEKLIADGRMQAAGLQAVMAAKSDGRWDAAYAGRADMKFPDEFMTAIAANTTARETFESLDRGRLYGLYLRLQTARQKGTQQKLIRNAIERLAYGEAA
jgi:uncharacterized protein YdeI (YjbR/CyaY-like superfamily)